MAAKTKPWLVLSLLLLVANCMQQCRVHGKSKVPCAFIFGDSISANGNNNNLNTSAKSNYPPYGTDFPLGPTGRFCNGRTEVDFTTQYMGFENFIPPNANTSGSDILEGVNYASAAAGIRPETGTHRGENINLENQIRNHRVRYNQIANKLGGLKKAKQYLNKCVYYIKLGANDYLGNFFLPQFYPTSSNFTRDQYAQDLIIRLSRYIQELHDDLAARKFALFGLNLLGCSPYAIATNGTNGSCSEEFNAAAVSFNNKLKSQVDRFNNKFRDSKFIFINSVTDNSTFREFTVKNAPCCPTVENAPCAPNGTPCPNRNEYVFWDGIHQTEAANRITAERSYNRIKRLVIKS